jgi:hypothetical protein
MRHIPKTCRTKAETASYRAGYKAGYDQRRPQTLLRHKDLRDVYNEGYGAGIVDREARKVKQAEQSR